jgi:galactose-1-phosphate uridylyltransferase
MKNAEIDKSADDNTICIHADENSVEIVIDEDHERAALILGKDRLGKFRVHKLNVEEEETGELRVYDDTLYNFLYKSGEELTRHFLQQLQEDYNHNTEKYLKLMKRFAVAIWFFIIAIITFICLIIKTILWR